MSGNGFPLTPVPSPNPPIPPKPVIRAAQIMEVPGHFDLTHFKAITIGGRKFVYCPIGNICSWAPGDYDQEWCHYCQKFFAEIRQS